ncbi:unnamed protein product [Miscanthus lutarioriparius]|uniref:BZIP domain-containing protein n=1 Tax=Miscanthus lutarioriparius TaxID=422564 RepID=A0A811RAQ7_9POAL|nr:unnamed protein product [Miscanthus lutarioriparius]
MAGGGADDDDVVEVSCGGRGGADDDDVVEVSCGGRGGGDPGAYAAMLKRKLDLYCAAVAKSMVGLGTTMILTIASNGSTKLQAMYIFPYIMWVRMCSTSGFPELNSDRNLAYWLHPALCPFVAVMFILGLSTVKCEPFTRGDIDGAGLVTNSNVIEDDDFQGKPANSGISKELSDDDGDLEETTDPANANKMRRMLSNRESARRSRKRKQAHLNDLESQVSRLTSENASLLKRLADMTQKYKDASLDNKNLTVDIETMRRKVNIAEEAVRRLTGTTLMLSTAFDKPASSTPLSSCASDAASASVAIEDSMKHFLQAPLQSGQMKLDIPKAAIPLTSGVIGTKPASLQRVASLENLQKRIIGDSVHSETASTFSGPEALADSDLYTILKINNAVAKAVIFDSGLNRLVDIKHHECRMVKNAASVEIDMKLLLLSAHVFCAGSY